LKAIIIVNKIFPFSPPDANLWVSAMLNDLRVFEMEIRNCHPKQGNGECRDDAGRNVRLAACGTLSARPVPGIPLDPMRHCV